MKKTQVDGRVVRKNFVFKCFTKETIKLQLTNCFTFLSLMVDKFECPLGINFKTKMFMKKIEAALT